jgi:hypothetical protein
MKHFFTLRSYFKAYFSKTGHHKYSESHKNATYHCMDAMFISEKYL